MKKDYTLVTFIRDIALPRFPLKKGDQWNVRTSRIEPDGFTLGGGYISSEDFIITFEVGPEEDGPWASDWEERSGIEKDTTEVTR